jgi:small conductance mechanosensitive channel
VSVTEILSQITPTTIVEVVLTVIVAVIVYKTISRILVSTAKRVSVPTERVHVVNNFLKVIAGSIVFISILGSLNIDVTGLIAGVSIVALAVGFAAQTIISNLISGLFLLFERVFTIGDLIQVGGVTGRVVTTGFRTTKLETVDGNLITIPNALLASSQLTNLTGGTNETTLVLDEAIDIYADLPKAKALMLHAAETASDALIDDAHQPFILVHRDATQWRVNLKLYVTVHAAHWYRAQSDLHEQIKHAFDAHQILPPITPIARSRLPDIQKELAGVDEQSRPSP